uniref:Ets DNA-binding protein pokkuri-like n=1 Tax=Hirondellea gigas TaxID=1518452 RepID=A0A2P2I1X0_9CRUS
MKVPPLNLTPEMNRVGMALPFSPELLWRSYPSMSFPQYASVAPPSPLEVKSQLDTKTLPSHLSLEPRVWSREDVISFLRWVEREYDLPSIDHTKFYMNGKALIMLNKADLTERAPDAGDIVHNTLQQIMSQSAHVPPSPITPHHPMLSPSPLTAPTGSTTQSWPLMHPDLHNLSHLLQQNSSVTLSPAHSEQSGGSPRHPDNASTTSNGSAPGYPQSGSQSDSEDSTRDTSSPQRSPVPAPPPSQPNFSAHALASFKQISDYQRVAAAAAAAAAAQSKHHEDAHYKHQLQQALQLQQQQQHQQQSSQHTQQMHQQMNVPQQTSHHSHAHQQAGTSPPLNLISNTSQAPSQQTTEDVVEPGTNGRLLWDFLQQLLNDRDQRYVRYISWRNAETGVFKIVDPPGLARLWGIQKNHLSMNYDKMSRALRYYYRVNILRKVQGERHCYQFLRNPSELRNIKNISSLKMAAVPPQVQPQQHQIQQHQVQAQQPIQMQQQLTSTHIPTETKEEEEEEEEGPTDLSMATLHHHSNSNPSSEMHHCVDSPQDMSIEQHYIKMEEYEAPISVDYDG